jgi:hypothetical protein
MILCECWQAVYGYDYSIKEKHKIICHVFNLSQLQLHSF